ncbi:MAG: DNRLRE domain-containing protein [Planctomycetes bacterium]|nr:DNRLRE domain-containing protein [Planctomycetota bacterium]
MDMTRLHQWLGDLCNGCISDADFAAMEQKLADDAEARAEYRRYMNMHATLRRFSHAATARPIRSAAPRAVASTRWRSWAGALAAMIIIGAGLTVTLLSDQATRKTPTMERVQPLSLGSVAVLSDASPDARFDASTTARGTGLDLSEGVLSLESGTAQVMYRTGARIELTGPCAFELSGANAGRLRAGRIVAHVPQTALGFTVQTDRFDVVDLGTQFGVDLTHDGEQVQVFEGHVMIRTHGGAMQTLDAGQRCRITTAGVAQLIEPSPATARMHTRTLTLTPIADAGVDVRYPDQPLGRETTFVANNAGGDTPTKQRWAYLRFDLSEVTTAIRGAKLVLTPTTPGVPLAGAVYALSDERAWDEAAMTWNTAPARVEMHLDATALLSGKALTTFDMNVPAGKAQTAFDQKEDGAAVQALSWARGHGITLIIARPIGVAPDDRGTAWASRETATPPTLMLEVDAPAEAPAASKQPSTP